MNAITDSTASTPRPSGGRKISTAQRFGWLLRREFWENRGGFLWAPAIAGGITLLFTVLAAIGASLLTSRSGNRIQIDDAAPPEQVTQALGAAGDVALLLGISISMVVLGFVVFFYALGSLHDDRRDRSILFWKSMPISDAATVGSKAAWALLLAPLLAMVVGILIGLALWVVTALTTTVNGVPGTAGLLTSSHPFRITGSVLALLPLYALWALPAVGWLMLCSAAARSKPFLWALIVPVMGCALVSMVSAILGFKLNYGALWYAVANRGLLSVFPGSWLPSAHGMSTISIKGPEDIPLLISPLQSWQVAGTLDLWLGVVAGIAMILLAIRLRRWREEG
ncbi:ABC transporter permease [Luteimonas sp. A277]